MTNNQSNNKTANKGEWSEFYAFVKILTDGKVFTADKDLKILEDHFHIVLKIIRQEAAGIKSYDISKNDGKVVISDNNSEIDIVELDNIKSSVATIFDQIKNSSGTTFTVTSALKVMDDLKCEQVKASSGKKVDLTIVLHDKKSPEFPELGFSIKSMLGSPATLLNASGATNFVYRLITDNESADTNEISSVREAAKYAYGNGKQLEFISMDNAIFRKNLRKIDSIFPQIIAEMLKHYYTGHATTVADLADKVSEDTEFMESIDFTKDMLVMNIKRFLSSVALGMMPSKDWDGYTEAHGGYIIVKENGDVVCYHLYNRDKFEDYLFYNTKFDTPSTTRHGFGKIYEEDGEQRLKLNLQIRFIK